jgi:hypothetical protein
MPAEDVDRLLLRPTARAVVARQAEVRGVDEAQGPVALSAIISRSPSPANSRMSQRRRRRRN